MKCILFMYLTHILPSNLVMILYSYLKDIHSSDSKINRTEIT